MKDQYVGDVGDYAKYGLLRALVAGSGLTLGLNWMLTPGDGRGDGGRTGYLARPGEWRAHDPDLFDGLAALLARGHRAVAAVERSGLLPGARFAHALVPGDASRRRAWARRARALLAGVDLAFFDPDNGLEVMSRPFGRRPSTQHVYGREIADTWRAGCSVLVFQHWTREARRPFLVRRLAQLAALAPGARRGAFLTRHVAFLLAARPAHLRALRRGAAEAARRWSGLIEVRFPDPAD